MRHLPSRSDRTEDSGIRTRNKIRRTRADFFFMTVKKEHFDRITAQQAARRRGPPEKARPFRRARAPLRRLAIKGFALSGDML